MHLAAASGDLATLQLVLDHGKSAGWPLTALLEHCDEVSACEYYA